jgi:hypothetical protein
MAPQSFQLVQRSGPAPGKIYSLTKNEIYMGRDITNDIVINDPEISRKHARLTLQAGGYLLEDLGSTNGSFVDGQRITGSHSMAPGEVIMLGDNVSLTYETADYDPEATMAVSQDEMPIPPAPPPAPFVPAPQPPPITTGQIPAAPPPPAAQPEQPASNTRTWVLAGCGCVVLVLCIVAAGVYAFDSLNLYCTPPFDALSLFFGYGCP